LAPTHQKAHQKNKPLPSKTGTNAEIGSNPETGPNGFQRFINTITPST